MRKLGRSAFVIANIALATPSTACGAWGLSIGYNDPPEAGLGVNFSYFWPELVLDLGIGGLGGSRSSGSFRSGLWGDVDVRYLFGTTWRPYLEAGLGLAFGANSSGGSASVGSPFAGGGLMLQGTKFYAYGGLDSYFRADALIAPVLGFGFLL